MYSSPERATALDTVLLTAQLHQRTARPPDYAAEQRALDLLTQELAHPAHDILQRLAEIAMELCEGGSAGISIIEDHLGKQVFRWHALTGALASHRWGTTPRDFSPCGTVIDRNAVQLMHFPERHFLYFANVKPQIVEALLVPFSVRDQLVGTIWVVAHDCHRAFDTEDERLIKELGRFAAEAYQLAPSVRVSKLHDRRKDEFLVTLANELRDPATAVVGLSCDAKSRFRTATVPRTPAFDARNGEWPLLRRMRSGDQRALEELYDCTVGSVYALALSILKSKEDAEEVVCDTYAQAWRQSERFDAARATPIGWLMMMCRSRAIDRRRHNLTRGAARSVSLDLTAELTHDALMPEDLHSLFHQGSRVHGALASLSPQQLRVVGLACFDGLSISEMADRTGMPLGTVKSHIRRALIELRRQLQLRGRQFA